MVKRKIASIIMSALLCANLLGTTVSAKAASDATMSSTITAAQSTTKATTKSTLADMPSNFKPSVEWVYKNRMTNTPTNVTNFKNLIFDQIYAGKGTLNYVVRWQSSKNLSLQQRKDMASMISRQINNWNKRLAGYDGWAYNTIKVNVVGWAVANPAQILNKQANETVYSTYEIDELSTNDPSIPAKLPTVPSSLFRPDHYFDKNYTYPGGYSKRIDMYLWGTTNFSGGFGGAGGDWGQRVPDNYIINNLASNEVHIIEHEIGHGFGLPDFYQDNERPPSGFPTPTIMWAGNSATITDWDMWMLRYTWSQLKKDTTRFK